MIASDPVIDPRTKGLPACAAPLRLSQIGAQRWNLLSEALPLPVAVLRQSALANNMRWMNQFMAQTGASLAPHGKTSMSPQLFQMQLDGGAWGITLATVQQVRVARAAGVRRIVLANQLVGPRDIEYVLDELAADAGFEFYCLVDSLAGVERLARAAAARAAGRALRVLVEIGYAGGRTGCRDLESALTVARAVKQAQPHLALHGIEGFEGLHQYLPGAEAALKVTAFLQTMVAAAQRADAEDLFTGDEVILSAGGSAYYDLVSAGFAQVKLRRRVLVVLRSGCYFTHDAGLYQRLHAEARARGGAVQNVAGSFENALEVWAYVLSVPEPRRVILGAGRRDFGTDACMPVVLKHFRPGRDHEPLSLAAACEMVSVNDQHAHLVFAADTQLEVGDMVALGVSHPCTTFDKWQLIYMVDDAYSVTSAVQTFF